MQEESWNEPAPAPSRQAGYSPQPPQPDALPGFCKAIAIIDIVMASIRLLLVPLSILGMSIMKSDDPLMTSVYFEIALGLLIGVAGIVAGTGMLMKKAWAVPVGWGNVLVTVLGILLGIWQATVIAANDPTIANDSAAQAGAVVGALIALGIRSGILILVIVALLKYKAWLAGARRF